MSTATITPQEIEVKKAPLSLTPQAITKVREIMATQDPLPAGLRIGVVGGGCSGFQYSMAFENQSGMMDKVFSFDDLKVFENPQVKSTCGCGSSFSV
jgi:Fe-S cluster assembly iron-binding protein IscA